MSTEKDEVLAQLVVLLNTCATAADVLSSLSSTSVSEHAAVEVLRKDALSLHRLIHTNTTRLSVSLGKPPPSYPIALVPIKDLISQVDQLVSCITAFPHGALRKEAAWDAQDTIRALQSLVKYFEKQCRKDEAVGKEYLAKTGAVHDAVSKAENMSKDELEAVSRVWKQNGEVMTDSLNEVKEMMEEKAELAADDVQDDGWDEALGEGFGKKLSSEELERVKKIYPFLRFSSLLHEKILSHFILKPLNSEPHTVVTHLTKLLTYSNSLSVATDELASALYGPQDVEDIQGGAELVYQLIRDLNREMGLADGGDCERLTTELAGLQLGAGSQSLAWFKKCFSQIDIIYERLSLKK